MARGEDAGLCFHSDAGAHIGELVRNYRPDDAPNLGYGVMICYELGGRRSVVPTPTTKEAPSLVAPPTPVALPTPSVPSASKTLAECELLVCAAAVSA